MELARLFFVIPCYNEEEALPISAKIMAEKVAALVDKHKIREDSRILLVNDGSKDKTWEVICNLQSENPVIAGLQLSRNEGHQNALLAGLMTAKDYCDISISMDADLQDDIHAVDQMIDAYYEGNDIVYGVRSSRKTDTVFKRFTAESYYKMLHMMGVEVVYNHADYRLMSKRALDALEEYQEVNVYLRGIIPKLGFPSTQVFYERSERIAGESKYPLRKMLRLAAEGVTSFSISPIKMIRNLGLSIFLVSIAMLIWSFIRYCRGKTEVGWASLFVSIWAIGGLILMAIGIVGEYIGKAYLETKHRPRYHIQTLLLDDESRGSTEACNQ